MEQKKVYRLAKVANEINTPIDIILDYLKSKNIYLDANPNAKISEDIRQLLIEFFEKDIQLKEKSKEITFPQQSNDSWYEISDSNFLLEERLAENLQLSLASKLQKGNAIEELKTLISNMKTENFEEYIQTLILCQKKFNKLVNASPQDAITFAHRVNFEMNYIDIEYFWGNLISFITRDVVDVIFFISDQSEKIIEILSNLLKKSDLPPIFIVTYHPDEEPVNEAIVRLEERTMQTDKPIFLLSGINLQQFAMIIREKGNSWLYSPMNVSFGFENNNFKKKFIIKRFLAKDKLKELVSNIKMEAALKYLPFVIKNICSLKLSNIKDDTLSKVQINSYETLDTKVQVFNELQNIEIISQYFHQIGQIKNDFITALKQQHKTRLSFDLDKIIDDFDKQEFLETKKIQPFLNGIAKLENDFFEDYEKLIEKVKEFKKKVEQEERRIKDVLLAKTYIIDTNVFIEDPDIISKIDSKHYVVLSHTAINELDKLKQKDKLKEKASKAIANLNKLLGNGKQLRTAKANTSILEEDYQQNSPDNRILAVAFMYKEKNPILLTNDNGLQLKAKSINIPTISLKDFLGVREVPKKVQPNAIEIDYLSIFKQMQSNKIGKYQISSFIEILKKQNPEFDYKSLGFSKAYEFIASLDIFEVTEKQFINLKP